MSIEDKLVYGEIYQINRDKDSYIYLGIQTHGGIRHVMATKDKYHGLRVFSFKEYKKENDKLEISTISSKKIRQSEKEYILGLLQKKLDALDGEKQK
jgi:hypothetical protein